MLLERRNISLIIAGVIAAAALFSCNKDDRFSYTRSENTSAISTKTVLPSERDRSVMLIYSAGYNTLNAWLKEDIDDLSLGYVPYESNNVELDSKHSVGLSDHILLVYSRNGVGKGNAPESALFRIYMKTDSTIVRDTIKVWGTDVSSCSKETMRDVLTTASEKFPSKTFGMVFTSHASGWLPCGYYNDPNVFENNVTDDFWYSPASVRRTAQEYFPPLEDYPAVKSIGQDDYPDRSVEFSLRDFADALPFKLDYLLIDACLSGGVEVAAELRGKADIVGFSLTEVLSDGFNYKTMTSHLLKNEPDPVAVCRDYYESYAARTGIYQSATISVVDTRLMDDLTEVCKTLFSKYDFYLENMEGSNVQGYFRFNRHFFYDLEDILVKSGIDESEKAALNAALEKCVIYKAATPWFMKGASYGFEIKTYSGLSMYLPSMGTDFLNRYYKETVAWNARTELVK